MEGLNPGEMAGSFDYVNYQGGYITVNETQQNNNLSIKDALGDLNKKEILDKITNYKLSDKVKSFVDEYEQNFDERNIFLWKFLGVIFTETGATLTSVDKEYFNSITDCKILFSILCAILDDVTDIHKDETQLKQMINVLQDRIISQENNENKKIETLAHIWKYLNDTIKNYPRYEEYKDIFNYDFKQFLNSFEYACVIDKHPKMMTLKDMAEYDCHNMMVYIFNGIDIMASSKLNSEDIPNLRTAFWYAQQMARIGNWLSTWKRELKEKDVSSGVFAYVFSNKIIDYDEFETLSDNEIIERIGNSNVNEYFMNIWKENYGKLVSLKEKISSVDMDAYIKGLENVIKYHMASEGLK